MKQAIKQMSTGLFYMVGMVYGIYLCFGGWIMVPQPYGYLSIIPGFLFMAYQLGSM